MRRAALFLDQTLLNNAKKAASKSLELNPVVEIDSKDTETDKKGIESSRKAMFKRAQSRAQLGSNLGEALQDLNKLVLVFHAKADFLEEAEKLKKQILGKMLEQKRAKEAGELLGGDSKTST